MLPLSEIDKFSGVFPTQHLRAAIILENLLEDPT